MRGKKYFYESLLIQLNSIARASRAKRYSGLNKDQLAREIEKKYYSNRELRCPCCNYNISNSWINWIFKFFDLQRKIFFSEVYIGFFCINCSYNPFGI